MVDPGCPLVCVKIRGGPMQGVEGGYWEEAWWGAGVHCLDDYGSCPINAHTQAAVDSVIACICSDLDNCQKHGKAHVFSVSLALETEALRREKEAHKHKRKHKHKHKTPAQEITHKQHLSDQLCPKPTSALLS